DPPHPSPSPTRRSSDLNDQLDRGELPDELTELHSAHNRATTAQRTAADFDTWRAGEVTQSAVAWVLGTVFVRWCEDNELIAPMRSEEHTSELQSRENLV